MIYLGNGIWSDAGSSLSHGGPWKDHKYIAIKNGRYIYPTDPSWKKPPEKKSERWYDHGITSRTADKEDRKWWEYKGKKPKENRFSTTTEVKLGGRSTPPPTKKVQNPNSDSRRRDKDKDAWKNDPKFKEAEKEYEKKIKKQLGVIKQRHHKPDPVIGNLDPYKHKNKAAGSYTHHPEKNGYERGWTTITPYTTRDDKHKKQTESAQKFKKKRQKSKRSAIKKIADWIKGEPGTVTKVTVN